MPSFLSTIFLCVIVFSHSPISLHASEATRKEYLNLLKQYPKLIQPLGDAKKGEIEIILNNEKMAAIEKSTGRDVGVIAKDKYWLWINDACLFPSGTYGVYGRILWVKSLTSTPGIAIMPLTSNGKIVLNCNFRHATRSWEIELPRGLINPHEDPESAAKREALEETGMRVESVALLGKMAPDSGVTNTVVPVYLAKVVSQEKQSQEDSEAIEEVLALTVSEIKKAFLDGYYPCTIRGEVRQIPFRDPFLSFALLMYELKR